MLPLAVQPINFMTHVGVIHSYMINIAVFSSLLLRKYKCWNMHHIFKRYHFCSSHITCILWDVILFIQNRYDRHHMYKPDQLKKIPHKFQRITNSKYFVVAVDAVVVTYFCCCCCCYPVLVSSFFPFCFCLVYLTFVWRPHIHVQWICHSEKDTKTR